MGKQVMKIAALGLLILVFLYPLYSAQATTKLERGFNGKLITEWLDDGRNMRLMGSFGYISPDKKLWKVPKGTIVNGASIPRFLWSFIGSPFGDKYRKASVIHDYYCETRSRDWKRVHKVFYEAMLDSGVDPSKAWLMYQAVERFGPRWDTHAVRSLQSCRKPDGSIDFANCARNAPSEKPSIVMPNADQEAIRSFLNEMKSTEHGEAAIEMEQAILQ